MPPHIAEMDHIICCAPADIRIVLIKFYGTGGTFSDKAIRLGLDKRSLRRVTDRADYYVNSELDRLPEKSADSAQNAVFRRNSRHIAAKLQTA